MDRSSSRGRTVDGRTKQLELRLDGGKPLHHLLLLFAKKTVEFD